eukprot:6200411-Pleurochrysis_carterae.AAC.5
MEINEVKCDGYNARSLNVFGGWGGRMTMKEALATVLTKHIVSALTTGQGERICLADASFP